MGAGHLAMYRQAMKRSEGTLTPDVLSRMSIPQKLLIFQPDSPSDVMAQAREFANQARARKGLPPLKDA
jgi:hypothetical protein